MIDRNKAVFEAFRVAHDAYDPKTHAGQKELDETGEDVLNLIRRFENILCGYSETSRYGKYSNKTAETFWGYIRKDFPHIDFIGMR